MFNFLLLLSLIAAVISLISYRVSGRDVFSCTVVTSFGICIGALLLYGLTIIWQVEIFPETAFIIGIGLFSCFLGEWSAIRKKKKLNTQINIGRHYFVIKYCNWLIVFYVLATFLYAWEIRKLGLQIGASGLASIGAVKENMARLNEYMNPAVKQLFKLVFASNFIHSIIFANNVFLAKNNWKKEVKHLVPFICSVFIIIVSGSRIDVFKELVALLFIIFVFLRESSGWKKMYLDRIVKYVVPVLLGFVFLFCAVAFVVKGENSRGGKDEIETFNYVSYYVGSPIQVLNLKADMGRNRWSYALPGYWTFNGLYNLFGIKDSNSKKIGNGLIHLGGRADYAGNAMTLFGGLYFDFDWYGVIIACFLIYYCFSRFYHKKIFKTYSSYKRNRGLILYAYFYSTIIALSFYDNCFWLILSSTGLLTLLVIYLMYWIYFKKLLIRRIS